MENCLFSFAGTNTSVPCIFNHQTDKQLQSRLYRASLWQGRCVPSLLGSTCNSPRKSTMLQCIQVSKALVCPPPPPALLPKGPNRTATPRVPTKEATAMAGREEILPSITLGHLQCLPDEGETCVDMHSFPARVIQREKARTADVSKISVKGGWILKSVFLLACSLKIFLKLNIKFTNNQSPGEGRGRL